MKFGAKYASIKEDDPFTLELPRALEIVEAKLAADRERTIRDFPEHGDSQSTPSSRHCKCSNSPGGSSRCPAGVTAELHRGT